MSSPRVTQRNTARGQRSRATADIRARCALRSIRKWCTGFHRRRGSCARATVFRWISEWSWAGILATRLLTVPVGKVTPEREKLLRVTRESLEQGIAKIRAGNRLGDVSAAVQQWVEKNGFSVVREFVGHGIGTKMHEDPQLPNYGSAGPGPEVARGHGAGIEPIVSWRSVVASGGG